MYLSSFKETNHSGYTGRAICQNWWKGTIKTGVFCCMYITTQLVFVPINAYKYLRLKKEQWKLYVNMP